MKKYDVALSFAGEDREHPEALAEFLKAGGYSCFYDKDELAQLWGKDLYDYLSSVYKDRARYCVMFLSKHYKRKLWTNHERQAAQARAFQENREYILPVLLDDTEIPGIPPTVGYLDLRLMTIEEVYEALKKKLGTTTDSEGNYLVYYNRGIGYSVIGEHDSAIKEYTTAIEHSADAYNNRGYAYYEKGKVKRAIEDYDQAIRLKPDIVMFYHNRSFALLEAQEWEKAKSDLTTVRNMGVDITILFHKSYGSIAGFEQRIGAQLPADIAAMLPPP